MFAWCITKKSIESAFLFCEANNDSTLGTTSCKAKLKTSCPFIYKWQSVAFGFLAPPFFTMIYSNPPPSVWRLNSIEPSLPYSKAVQVPASEKIGFNEISSSAITFERVSPTNNNPFFSFPDCIMEVITDKPYTYPAQPWLISRAIQFLDNPNCC